MKPRRNNKSKRLALAKLAEQDALAEMKRTLREERLNQEVENEMAFRAKFVRSGIYSCINCNVGHERMRQAKAG